MCGIIDMEHACNGHVCDGHAQNMHGHTRVTNMCYLPAIYLQKHVEFSPQL